LTIQKGELQHFKPVECVVEKGAKTSVDPAVVLVRGLPDEVEVPDQEPRTRHTSADLHQFLQETRGEAVI